MLSYGAAGGVSVSPFIASVESDVSEAYKQACVDYGGKDIVVTERISGTPCTVINTPYVQKIGTKQPWYEALLNKNKRLKKMGQNDSFFYRNESNSKCCVQGYLQNGLGGRS